MNTIQDLQKTADNIRLLSLAMVEKAKSGHPGGAMGGADFMAVLYSEFIQYNPDNSNDFTRDRFFLDPGHMSPMLYATLCFAGYFSVEELKNFRQFNATTHGHPERNVAKGIENTSGPLGQGHAMGLGAALAERLTVARFGQEFEHKTYVYISDGGIQEEVSQGVGRIAGDLGLSNLIMYYDANNVQLSTYVDEITHENIAEKYKVWGWNVITINGHDINEIRQALQTANQMTDKPTLIIGKTIMGKGLKNQNNESFENQVSTHGQPASAAGASIEKSYQNLGLTGNDPFVLYPETLRVFEKRKEELRSLTKKKEEVLNQWKSKNPILDKELVSYLQEEPIVIGEDKVTLGKNIATRQASGNVLAHLANYRNVIVMSADLAVSDKTDSFLQRTKPIDKKDFEGSFLHVGVSELTMACLANGIALHGGFRPVCATFFVFSDYMKPAIRMSALMKLPVTYLWTHDSFRVGEDGPTHQPIEQEAQIRLMEKVKHHDGESSMIVLRPADTAETLVAWQFAITSKRPTGLVLTRENVVDIVADNRLLQARQLTKGAYTVYENDVQPEMILVGSGSDVNLLLGAAKILESKKMKVRVVSVPSEGLFREQPVEYQHKILPKNINKVGLTSGLSCNLLGLVGDIDKIWSVETFGYSAPYKQLEEKFGFTVEHIAEFCEKCR